MKSQRIRNLGLALLALSLAAVLMVAWASADTEAEAEVEVAVASKERDPGAQGCVAPDALRYQDLVKGEEAETVPWERTDEQVDVYFEMNRLAPEYRKFFDSAAVTWSQSVCVDAHVVDLCPPDTHCVPAMLDDTSGEEGADGMFMAEYTEELLLGGTLHLYRDYVDDYSDAERQLVVTHEMGHAIGLGHRNDDDVMRGDGGESNDSQPDAVDFANLVALYGNA